MIKTKTKRTIWTILIVVVALVVAAIFYAQKQNIFRAPEEVREVKVEESIKAEEANPVSAETNGPREYISEYFAEKDRFNAIGVSWEEVSARDGDISLAIRVKNNGSETDWLTVYKNFVKTEAGITYYTAESPILSRGDEYQYRVTFAKPANEVRNIKFDIINTMGTSYTRFIDKVRGTFTQDVSAASWNPSNIISRATWGGSTVNASATLWPPQYAEKSTKLVVHHTVSTNYSCASYSQDEAEADVKAIWQYHTYGNDWGDIGYNYLVDPCGRVYEGRLGGNNVIAGHASPYNYWDKVSGDGKIDEATIGVSILGDYSHYVPEGSAFEGFGRILGYKSYINAINPLGASTIKDKYTYNIAGHRDYWSTACPGAELYARLSSVRSAASAHKNLYLADYGDYETITKKITLNSARVSMEDISTPEEGDFVLAANPAIGEPVTMLSAIKNSNAAAVTLENVRVVGILDNGTEFTIGQTPSLTINAGQTASIPAASYNISSFRYQTYLITYELPLSGPGGAEIIVRRSPTISTTYVYPSIVPHYPIVKTTANITVNPQSLKEGENLNLAANIRNYDSRPAYLYNFGPTVSVGSFSHGTQKILPAITYTYNETRAAANPGVYTVKFAYRYGNGATSELIPTTTSLVTAKSLSMSPATINYNNIKLNSFRASMENVSTGGLTLASSPAIGEPITITAILKNDNNYPVTLQTVRARGVLDSGTEFTIGTQDSLTINALSTATISLDKNYYNITSSRSTSYYLDYFAEAQTRTPNIGTYVYQTITPHFPVVKITNGPYTNPSNPVLSSPAILGFELKNYDPRPAYLNNLFIQIDYESSFESLPSIATLKIKPGLTYRYEKPKTFSALSDIDLSGYFDYGNGITTQIKNSSDALAVATTSIVSAPLDFSKISLNSFRVTMEDTSTPLDDVDYVLADLPAIGEPVSVRPVLYNGNATAITVSNVKVNGTLSSGTRFVVGTIPTLTLPASTATAVPVQTFNITSSYIHTFNITYEANGITRSPYVKPTYSYQQILAHRPSVKVTKTPVFTPTTPIAYSAVTTTYKLTNYDARPAYLRNVTLLAKLNNSVPYYFPKKTVKIIPATTYQYSQSIIPANGGTYYSNVEVTYGNGSVAIPASLSSTSSYANFKVYTEVATLEGVPLPATTGKTAWEDHLNVVAGCNSSNYLTTRESISHHYSATGVDYGQMAWVVSGGCGYGAWGAAPTIANERYYINMRWNYEYLSTGKGYNGQPVYADKSWYYGKKVVVTHSVTKKKVVAAIVEYGPGIMTRVSGLSPEAMRAIGAVTDNTLNYAWAANQSMPLGPIN